MAYSVEAEGAAEGRERGKARRSRLLNKDTNGDPNETPVLEIYMVDMNTLIFVLWV